jgi:hypothetical protein
MYRFTSIYWNWNSFVTSLKGGKMFESIDWNQALKWAVIIIICLIILYGMSREQ